MSSALRKLQRQNAYRLEKAQKKINKIFASMINVTIRAAFTARKQFCAVHGRQPERGDMPSVSHGVRSWAAYCELLEASGFEPKIGWGDSQYEYMQKLYLEVFIGEAEIVKDKAIEKSDGDTKDQNQRDGGSAAL